MKRSKRYLISLIAGVLLSILAFISVFQNMEGLASACVAGIMTILTGYIWGETKRPSKTNNHENDTQ
jgi:VIT1/CCC1 family predicted Fe2+/Mn2+ transporter